MTMHTGGVTDKVTPIETDFDRSWVFCSALCLDIDKLWLLLRSDTVGFFLDGSTEAGEDLALGKIQSIAATFAATSDDEDIYELESQLNELLLLMSWPEIARSLQSPKPAVRFRWRKSALDAWPFAWKLISELAGNVLELSGKAPLDFWECGHRFRIRDTSDLENPDIS